MILLIDNYDSFTYNLAQYIGTFSSVEVLRNDDPRLYQVAEKAKALVFSPGPGWPASSSVAATYSTRPESLKKACSGPTPG